jgi:hypothetical protein
MNVEIMAKSLLEKRENGISVMSGLRTIKGRLLFRFAMLGVLYFLYSQSSNNAFLYLGAGYILGMTIQDISWFATIAKTWSFSCKVTDWEKVEELAGKNS